MKKMIFLFALGTAWSAFAQAPAKPAAPAQEEAKPQAMKPVVAKPARMAKKSRRTQDARHCLERGDNDAIIRCAEEYL